MNWTLRTLCHQSNTYDKSNIHQILRHIHDSSQILDITCKNGKRYRVSVVIRDELRDEHHIYHSLLLSGITADELDDFYEAYDEWYYLYHIPILAHSEYPVPLSEAVAIEKYPSIRGILGIVKDLFLTRAKPIACHYVLVEEE